MHPIFHKIMDYLYNAVEYDNIIIMESEIRKIIDDTSGIVEKISDVKTIEDIYRNTNRLRSGKNHQIETRLKHGLEFFTFSLDGKIVATTWILYNIPRFIDEIVTTIEPASNYLWIRDIYTIDSQRGNNIFSRFIYKIAHEYYQGNSDRLYSDTSPLNTSSLRAHRKYGFKTILDIKYLNIFNKILIRRIPDTRINVKAYKREKSILAINSDFSDYVGKYIA